MKKGFICLAVITLVADLFLSLKFTGNLASDVIGISSAFVLSALTVLFIKFLLNLLYKSRLKNKNLIENSVGFLFLILFLILIVFTLSSFCEFAAPFMLSTKNIFFPSCLTFLIALLLGGKKDTVLYKISLIILPVTLTTLILIAAFSVQFMDAKYLAVYKLPDASFIKVYLPIYLKLTASAAPLLVFCDKVKYKSLASSYLIAFLVIAVCFINVLGIFGSELASTLNYPYAVAVSTASMGEIFSRLDGFFYAICFFATLIKTGLCVFSFKQGLVKFISNIKP